jgi:Phosphoesterase family
VRLAGGTARNYVEGATTGCSASGNAAKHIPDLYYYGTYTDSSGVPHNDHDFCSVEVRPYSEFDVNNLPTYAFITPTLCNDGHDCNNSTVDAWASTNVQAVLNSAAYQSGNTAVFIWYDEDHPVPNVQIAPTAHAGDVTQTGVGTHAALLKTIELMLGLPVMQQGQLTTAADLRAITGLASTGGSTVSVSPTSATVPSGGTKQFTDTVTGTTSTAVNWSASAGTVSTSGLYTAPTVSVNTTATVKATSVSDPTKWATASVTITPPLTAAVTISPTSATVASGGTKQFTASVTGTTSTAVNWSASTGTVSSGLYTAPTVGVNTTATVKATSVADSTKWATASVTITPPPINPNFSLSVTPLSQTVVRGSTTKYTINVTPSSGFIGSVALAVTGLSGGARATFSPASVTVSGTTSASSIMTIATGKGRTGTFTLTISASSGSFTHSTTVSLTTTR